MIASHLVSRSSFKYDIDQINQQVYRYHRLIVGVSVQLRFPRAGDYIPFLYFRHDAAFADNAALIYLRGNCAWGR